MIAYQIRQSFKPGEAIPEEANKIGYELVMSFTKGKYACIVVTHTDRAHIHNHIVFNSITLDGSRKFVNFFLIWQFRKSVTGCVCNMVFPSLNQKPYSQREKSQNIRRSTHFDKHFSMKLSKRYHCFGCRTDGDAISFVARYFDLRTVEAVKKLADDFGISYDDKTYTPS